MELLLFLSFVSFFSEVLSDYCGEDKFCHSPYKCCESRKECCYDSMLHSNQLFRLQIWNMWYFWLLVIFMLMSCFGGCGYYRRRRLALMSRSSSLTRPDTILPAPCHSSTRRSRNQEGSRQFNFFAYNGPGFNGPEPVSNLPPAYYEVCVYYILAKCIAQFKFLKRQFLYIPGNITYEYYQLLYKLLIYEALHSVAAIHN
uniref:WW domain binding protein VOPP1 n=1 Tax=Biomphalaria glabrata TaxID=6526 RepID=A0A2C9LN03_BIOGL